MRYVWFILLITGSLACAEEVYYPRELYGYQVEYLLAGKSWQLDGKSVDGVGVDLSACTDDRILAFDSIVDNQAYVVFYEINTCAVPDTVRSDTLNATALDSPPNFTDSLVSLDGQIYWNVLGVSPTGFRFQERTSGQTVEYLYSR